MTVASKEARYRAAIERDLRIAANYERLAKSVVGDARRGPQMAAFYRHNAAARRLMAAKHTIILERLNAAPVTNGR